MSEIITFKIDNEAVKIANATLYGLQAGGMACSIERAMRVEDVAAWSSSMPPATAAIWNSPSSAGR